MKRLFGLIGILYLSTLTAVFYFKSKVLIILVLISAAALVALGIYKRVKRDRYSFKTFVTAGATVALAVLSIFLYQNYYIAPIINNYSDKEISVEGYVCEEIKYKDTSVEYLIQTTAIDSKPVFTKIKYTGYNETEIKEFDFVKLNVKAYAENNDRSIAHRVLLRAYEKSPENITPTGDSKPSLYKFAISARKEIGKSFGKLMPKQSAELSRAIMLGDKDALDDDVLDNFRKTGTSFLIVVSGLHLSVALAFVTKIISRFTKRRIPLCVASIIVIIGFAALTGFNYSVIRAATAVIIYQIGRILLRNSDPLNSLGFAALAITIINPCAVGDLGLLMSFSATMGIILWADKINGFFIQKTNAGKIKKKIIKKPLYFFFNLISVSIAAAIWILPISIIAFGKISPIVVIVALFTEPFASGILVLSLLCAIFYAFHSIPGVSIVFDFIARVIAFADNFLCQALIWFNEQFSKLPFVSVKADSAAVYIWLAVTAVLVIIGYLIKAKRTYVISAINISFALMLILTAVSFLTADKSSRLTVYQSGKGVCIELKKGYNISLLSAGGNNKVYKTICEDATDSNDVIDNIIIPKSNNYDSLLPDLATDYKINNLITNTMSAEDIEQISSVTPYVVKDESIQTVKLNTEDSVKIISTDDVLYQYIHCGENNVLFVPSGGNIQNLPEEYRCADYVILDGIPRNCELIDSDDLIFTGSVNEYYNEKLDELRSQNINVTVLKNKTYTIK